MDETARRRALQEKFNEEHGITPKTVIKNVRGAISGLEAAEDEEVQEEDIEVMIANLKSEMLAFAENLEFERAAELRDRIKKLEKERK